MKKIRGWIPYLTLLMAAGLILFTVLDGYNPCMQWLTGDASKVYIYLFCAFSTGTSLLCVRSQNRKGHR